jgi:hypothetical protein
MLFSLLNNKPNFKGTGMNTFKNDQVTAITPSITSVVNNIYTLTTKDRFSDIRAMLGRSCAASQYSKLSSQQKAIILFGARLKPSIHIYTPLENMTFDEQEQIRLSILSLRDLTKMMSAVGLDREQFVTAKIEAATDNSLSDLAGKQSGCNGSYR